MRRLFLAPLVAVLSACPPPVDTGADGGGAIVVGPEGGNFVREGALIEIPANALSTEAIITVEVIDDDQAIGTVPNRKRISYGYRFRPTTLVFNEPVTITLPWLEDRIPSKGIDTATFDMRRRTGDDPYLQLPSPNALPDLKVVRATTDSLGLFWITSPLKPAVSEVKLTPEEAFLQVGGTQQFSAEVTDPAGTPLPDVEVKWSIVPARVASVDETGLVTALDPGTATLTVTAGDALIQANVFVVGTTVGPTSFIHENPFPTGNDLYGGAIANGHAFFVGSNATVLSRDPQNAWARHFSTPAVTLRDVGGSFPAGAVAVGTSGNTGILVEMVDPGMPPVVKVLQTVEPIALWFDGTHGMGVGRGNDVVVRRNGEWITDYSPSFETLLDVIGDGQGGYVTVGARGSVYQYDPAKMTWDSLYQTQLNVLLTGGVITQVNGSDIWAIGGNKLWHFQGAGWTALNLPATPVLEDLTAIGQIDGRIIVAGHNGSTPHLLVYEPSMSGGTWTSQALRPRQLIRGIFGSGADGYAVGDLGAVWQYAAGTFTEVSSGFYGDVADVYATEGMTVAAVNECANAACTFNIGKVVQRTASGSWQELGFQPFNGTLFSVAVKSPTEVYAGGEGSIWRYNGQSWTPQFLSGLPFFDLAVCTDTVWAVGGGGAVFSGTMNLSPRAPVTTEDLHAIHCQDDNEIWIGGDEVLIRWPKGASKGTFVVDQAVNHALYRAVWTPAAGEAYAFGEARYGTYWNTQNLRVYDAPGGLLPEAISGMWGSSVDNLYALGFTVNPLTFGYAVRFNGAQWSLVDTGAQRNPTAIHGYGTNDIFIGTEGGGLLRAVPAE